MVLFFFEEYEDIFSGEMHIFKGNNKNRFPEVKTVKEHVHVYFVKALLGIGFCLAKNDPARKKHTKICDNIVMGHFSHTLYCLSVVNDFVTLQRLIGGCV